MNLIDTHTHLHFPQFDRDRADVIRRATETGVTRMITLGTDLASSIATVEIAEANRSIYAAVGIHPSEAHQADKVSIREIKSLASSNRKVVAIGEIGLDFYWDKTHFKAQYAIFSAMLAIAEELRLPVVIHNRSAHREMEWFFQEEGIHDLQGVMHCFSGDIIDARFYLDMGLHISFTANITYPDFKRLDVVKFVPPDRILLETDSPYMSPHPLRKQRNEPAHVIYVAQKLAEIHGTSVEEIARRTTVNAQRLFRLPETE